MIEWRENAPKWVQVAEVLKQRIADGTYLPDTRLPSQHELVREFEIVPNTAQKVLTKLREQGVGGAVAARRAGGGAGARGRAGGGGAAAAGG